MDGLTGCGIGQNQKLKNSSPKLDLEVCSFYFIVVQLIIKYGNVANHQV